MQTTEALPIGFVGCGQMGNPIARNLLRAGYHLRVYDKDPHKSTTLVALNQGAIQVSTPGAAVEPGGLVVSMVPNDEALLQIALGNDGILHRLGPGGVHLSLSTISPALSEQLVIQYAEHGCTYLAGNVSGRPDVAEKRQLSIYLAGDQAGKERVQPLLRAIGSHIYDLGERVVSANVVKLAANYLIISAIAAMGSAAVFVERHGVSRETFLQAMRESVLFQGSAVYSEYSRFIEQRDYSDARFSLANGIKDATLILEAAHEVNVSLPMIELALEALVAAKNAGRTDQDWSVLAEYLIESAVPLAARS